MRLCACAAQSTQRLCFACSFMYIPSRNYRKNVATTTNQAKKQHILRLVGTLAILSYIVVQQHIQKQQLWMGTKGDRPNIAQNILPLL